MQMECRFQCHYFNDGLYDEYQRVNDDVLAMDSAQMDHRNKMIQEHELSGEMVTNSSIMKNQDSIGNLCSTNVTDSVVQIGETRTTATADRKNKQSITICNKKQKLQSGKFCYKHIPHKEKPPHVVERRNARERRRVQAVNFAFARLRKSVPLENKNKRISKAKTLQTAIDYINHLQDILNHGHNQ
ncbi:hypothetical protein CHUAL_006597 [Chamberlinius hualienensis]